MGTYESVAIRINYNEEKLDDLLPRKGAKARERDDEVVEGKVT